MSIRVDLHARPSGGMSWRGAAIATCAALLSAGCSEGTGLVQTSDEPFLYAVLAPEPVDWFSTDSTVRALLLTTGSPIRSPFRTAQSFEMRRASDNALFAWRETPGSVDQPPVGFRDISAANGNFVLAEGASADALGRRDLRAGESYLLRIETEGRIVTGSVTIPMQPVPVLTGTGAARVVTWEKVPAAGGYRIESNIGRFGSGAGLTRNTRFELRLDEAPLPESAYVRVTAVDSNLYRYVTDTTIGRAGISGGFGVFGAVSATTRLSVPRDPP